MSGFTQFYLISDKHIARDTAEYCVFGDRRKLLIFGLDHRSGLRLVAEMGGISEICFGQHDPSRPDSPEQESADRPTPKRQVGVGSGLVFGGRKVGSPMTEGHER